MRSKIIIFCLLVLLATAFPCRLFTPGEDTTGSDALKFSPDALPEGKVGEAYNAVIRLSNQRTPAFDLGANPDSLPEGISGIFDQEQQTYTLSGIPTQAGNYPLTITALCYGTNVSGQAGEKEYTLLIE